MNNRLIKFLLDEIMSLRNANKQARESIVKWNESLTNEKDKYNKLSKMYNQMNSDNYDLKKQLETNKWRIEQRDIELGNYKYQTKINKEVLESHERVIKDYELEIKKLKEEWLPPSTITD